MFSPSKISEFRLQGLRLLGRRHEDQRRPGKRCLGGGGRGTLEVVVEGRLRV